MPNHFPGDPCSVYTGDDIFPEFPLFRVRVYSENSLVRFAHSLVNKNCLPQLFPKINGFPKKFVLTGRTREKREFYGQTTNKRWKFLVTTFDKKGPYFWPSLLVCLALTHHLYHTTKYSKTLTYSTKSLQSPNSRLTTSSNPVNELTYRSTVCVTLLIDHSSFRHCSESKSHVHGGWNQQRCEQYWAFRESWFKTVIWLKWVHTLGFC